MGPCLFPPDSKLWQSFRFLDNERYSNSRPPMYLSTEKVKSIFIQTRRAQFPPVRYPLFDRSPVTWNQRTWYKFKHYVNRTLPITTEAQRWWACNGFGVASMPEKYFKRFYRACFPSLTRGKLLHTTITNKRFFSLEKIQIRFDCGCTRRVLTETEHTAACAFATVVSMGICIGDQINWPGFLPGHVPHYSEYSDGSTNYSVWVSSVLDLITQGFCLDGRTCLE